MFGYVSANFASLSDEQRARFRAFYCGMCKTLHTRYGSLSRTMLSYDMTFLALVLTALYEPEELSGRERCAMHPLRTHDYVLSPIMEYAADLNIALAYHKCKDNREDEANPIHALPEKALRSAYSRAKERQREKCLAIESWMDAIRAIEQSGCEQLDPPMNLTGKMLGTLFCLKDDCWSDLLRQLGDGLGRFIYFMDAYDDLKRDVRKHKYNPLKPIMHQADFDELCKQGMMMMMASSADAFERLPILQDADLIRNTLYSGVWARFGKLQAQQTKRRGTRACKTPIAP